MSGIERGSSVKARENGGGFGKILRNGSTVLRTQNEMFFAVARKQKVC